MKKGAIYNIAPTILEHPKGIKPLFYQKEYFTPKFCNFCRYCS
jgi:hypothetical protein